MRQEQRCYRAVLCRCAQLGSRRWEYTLIRMCRGAGNVCRNGIQAVACLCPEHSRVHHYARYSYDCHQSGTARAACDRSRTNLDQACETCKHGCGPLTELLLLSS